MLIRGSNAKIFTNTFVYIYIYTRIYVAMYKIGDRKIRTSQDVGYDLLLCVQKMHIIDTIFIDFLNINYAELLHERFTRKM